MASEFEKARAAHFAGRMLSFRDAADAVVEQHHESFRAGWDAAMKSALERLEPGSAAVREAASRGEAHGLERFRDHPAGFINEVWPGVRLRPWQEGVANLISGMKLYDHSPIKIARSCGHGVGATALLAWLGLWFFATRPNACVVMTAATETQIREILWPAVRDRADDLPMQVANIYHKIVGIEHGGPLGEDWRRLSLVPATNYEAFAGAMGDARVMFLLDNAAGVPNAVWEVIRAAEDCAEFIQVAVGTPDRKDCQFRKCFDDPTWDTGTVSARGVPGVGQDWIGHIERVWGPGNDLVKVRVDGEFPE